MQSFARVRVHFQFEITTLLSFSDDDTLVLKA